MTKTLAARTAIQTKLKTLADSVYYDSAGSKAVFPYVVFSIEEIDTNDGMTLCEIEVNVLDYGNDTESCETLADNIQNALDFFLYIDSDIEFATYKSRRQPLQEEDKKIIKRRLTFEMRLHGRG